MPPRSRHRHRSRKDRPSRLSDLLGASARKWRMQHLHRLEVIRRRWIEAAGEYAARYLVPVRLVRKTLRVAVPDSAWASEATYLAGPILERLRALLPGGWVEEIKPVLTEPECPLPIPTPQVKLKEPTPRMQGRAELIVGHLPPGELRDAVRRAVLAALRRLDDDPDDAVDRGGHQNRRGGRS